MDTRNVIIVLMALFIIWQLLPQSSSVLLGNSEVWEWTDYRGNKRKMEVSRSLH